MATDAVLEIVLAAVLAGRLPAVERALAVVGMDHAIQPGQPEQLLLGDAGVFSPLAAEPVALAVGQIRPHQIRQRLGDGAPARFALAQEGFDALALLHAPPDLLRRDGEGTERAVVLAHLARRRDHLAFGRDPLRGRLEERCLAAEASGDEPGEQQSDDEPRAGNSEHDDARLAKRAFDAAAWNGEVHRPTGLG